MLSLRQSNLSIDDLLPLFVPAFFSDNYRFIVHSKNGNILMAVNGIIIGGRMRNMK